MNSLPQLNDFEFCQHSNRSSYRLVLRYDQGEAPFAALRNAGLFRDLMKPDDLMKSFHSNASCAHAGPGYFCQIIGGQREGLLNSARHLNYR